MEQLARQYHPVKVITMNTAAGQQEMMVTAITIEAELAPL